MRMKALSGKPLYADWKVRAVGSIGIAWAKTSPFEIDFPREFIANGNDNIVFSWAAGPRHIAHLGRELELGGADAVLLSCSEPGAMALPSGGSLITINIPRAPLRALLRDGEACLGAQVSPSSDAVNLLLRYADILRQDGMAASSQIQELVSAHIYDLLAVAIGPTKDAVGIAQSRGLRAARLQAIKADVMRIIPGNVSISRFAAQHGLRVREIERLFHEEGQTFTEFVRDRRLEYAHRLLLTARLAHLRIADIAYEAGFNDLSYFNRMFRRRYGMSPGDVRAAGMSPAG